MNRTTLDEANKLHSVAVRIIVLILVSISVVGFRQEKKKKKNLNCEWPNNEYEALILLTDIFNCKMYLIFLFPEKKKKKKKKCRTSIRNVRCHLRLFSRKKKKKKKFYVSE